MSIFSGVEPPAWLQNATRPTDTGAIGQVLGTAAAGGFLAASEDKPWSEGVADARMNQQDPMWRLKKQQLEVQTLGHIASAESAWQSLQTQKQDVSDWMNVDLPALSKWQEEAKTNPDAIPPIARSSQGMKVVNQIERNQYQREAIELRKANAKTALERQKVVQDFTDAYTSDPNVQSQIEAMGNDAWNLDPKTGQALSPSPKALAAYNAWATNNGQNPERAFGFKSNAVLSAKARGDVAAKLEGLKADNRVELQAQKDQAAMEREKVRLQGPYGEMETGTVNGETYVKWGKQWKWFPNDEHKAKVAIVTAKIKELQKALLTVGGKDAAIEKQLQDAWKEMDAEFAKGSRFQSSPKSTPSGAKPNSDPLGLFK